MRAHGAGAKVDGAGRCVQPPWVGVELVDGGGVLSVGLRQLFHRGDPAGRCDIGGVLFLNLGGGSAADQPRQIEHAHCRVKLPPSPVPFQPLAPTRDIPEVSPVLPGETHGKIVIAKRRRGCAGPFRQRLVNIAR